VHCKLRGGDEGQLARGDPLQRRATLPVGVHKAQKAPFTETISTT
jgi:hypothetical protein